MTDTDLEEKRRRFSTSRLIGSFDEDFSDKRSDFYYKLQFLLVLNIPLKRPN